MMDCKVLPLKVMLVNVLVLALLEIKLSLQNLILRCLLGNILSALISVAIGKKDKF